MTFTYKLEQTDGMPAEPPSFRSAVPNWRPGDTIPIGRDRTLRVVGIVAGAELDDHPGADRRDVRARNGRGLNSVLRGEPDAPTLGLGRVVGSVLGVQLAARRHDLRGLNDPR
jgi:hypothetical protein